MLSASSCPPSSAALHAPSALLIAAHFQAVADTFLSLLCSAMKNCAMPDAGAVGYLMPEEQQVEGEEDEDEEMDEEYTPEMAQELIRRGLILSKQSSQKPSTTSSTTMLHV